MIQPLKLTRLSFSLFSTLFATAAVLQLSSCEQDNPSDVPDGIGGNETKVEQPLGGSEVETVASPSEDQEHEPGLVGTWLRSWKDHEGAVYRFTTTYKEDGTLDFSMDVVASVRNNKVSKALLSGKGTWVVEDGKMRSEIASSSDHELAKPGTKVNVEILELTADTLRYRPPGQSPVTETRARVDSVGEGDRGTGASRAEAQMQRIRGYWVPDEDAWAEAFAIETEKDVEAVRPMVREMAANSAIHVGKREIVAGSSSEARAYELVGIDVNSNVLTIKLGDGAHITRLGVNDQGEKLKMTHEGQRRVYNRVTKKEYDRLVRLSQQRGGQ